MKKIPIFALLLLICTQQGISQNWSWKAALAPVHKTEYYNVFLPANVTCKLKPNYGNLRLLDENGNEVPYLFFSEKQIDQQVSLNWYQHLKNDISQLRYSRSYFSNPKANRIDRIVLKVRNA
ncbi:MAG TPA: hypothetical protein ENJ82_15650, partial [Bacteroidetes bacterium]|nr:hypothetical protein [Bacteroidota bacterium]